MSAGILFHASAALAGLSFAVLPVWAATTPRTREISDMFYMDTLPKPVAPKKPRATPKGPAKRSDEVTNVSAPSRRRVGLKYRIQLASQAGDSGSDVDPGRVFRSGDAIRLVVETNINGFLYVVMKGSSGSESLLFPDPRINGGKNTVTANTPYTVPAGGWFHFDATAGEEKLLLVVSRSPLENLPTRAPDEQNPPVSVNVLMAELNRSVQSRDLVFVKEEKPAPTPGASPSQAILWVNASDTENQTVYATVNLQHR